MRSPTAGIVYVSWVETSAERLRPAMSGAWRTWASCSSSPSAKASPEKTPARMAPSSRIRRVTARVSMPEMPTTPWATRSPSSVRCPRKLETTREGSRTTYPATQMRRDSMSSSFMPVLPMCGAVWSTIWPA